MNAAFPFFSGESGERITMMIRIVHTADLHLDREIFAGEAKLSQKRRAEQRALFTDIMMYVRDKRVDLLFFCGDLLDAPTPEKETEELLLREFSNTPGCEIFICPGSHDPYRPGSFWAEGRFPGNVHIFKEDRVTFFEVPRLNARVYGYAFKGRRMTQRILADPPETDPAFFNLFCGCANLHGEKLLCPVSGEEIARSAFDYLAFGGEHEPSALFSAGGRNYAVCGSPESVGFDDCGSKSMRIAAMDRSDGKLLFQSKCVSVARKRFIRYELSAADRTQGDLANELFEKMRADGVDGNCYVEVLLTGNVPYDFRVDERAFERPAARAGYFTVVDGTLSQYVGEIGEKGSARAVFAAIAAEKISDIELRSKVLKAGMAAFGEE